MGLVLAEQSLQSDNALSSINTTQAWGGGGGSHRSDNALTVYQQHTAWAEGGGGVVTGLTMPCYLSIAHSLEGGGVTGLTMPCQSINSTQPGGGRGDRSDNALSVYQ